MSTSCDICDKLIPYDEGVDSSLRQEYEGKIQNLHIFICKSCARKLAHAASGGRQFKYEVTGVPKRIPMKVGKKLKCSNCECYRTGRIFKDDPKYYVYIKGSSAPVTMCESCALLYFPMEDLQFNYIYDEGIDNGY